GNIYLRATVTNDLTIKLVSSRPDILSVPEQVTILSHQSQQFFEITFPDNSLIEGANSVLVSATAENFYPVEQLVNVEDDDPARLVVNVPVGPCIIDKPVLVQFRAETIMGRPLTEIDFSNVVISAVNQNGAMPLLIEQSPMPGLDGYWSLSIKFSSPSPAGALRI